MSTCSNIVRAHPKVSIEHVTYEWRIRDFKYLPQSNGEHVTSPIFHSVNNEVQFKLRLYPRGKSEGNANYLSLSLHLHSQKDEDLRMVVHVRISVHPIGTRATFVHIYEKGRGPAFPRFIRRSELLESCSSDGTVTIRCKIDIPWDAITINRANEVIPDDQWTQDFRALLEQSEFSDVTIIAGDEKFTAHKVVLAASSPIFFAMFEHERVYDNHKLEVKVEGMRSAVVGAMLEFLYTDEVTHLEDLALELLIAADTYRVQRLRYMCEEVLYTSLDAQNAAEILIHADLHRLYELKERVMAFMIHNLADVVQSDSYRDMEDDHPELTRELVRLIAFQKKSTKR